MNQNEFHRQDGMQPKQFPVNCSPYISSGENVRGIMLDVIIALLPALGVSTYFFGMRVLLVAAVSIASCVILELLYCLLLKKTVSIGDLSAAVTGLLLAMCLPAAVPYWIIVIGAFIAIIAVKQLLGGLGKNPLNPALAGYVSLFCFPELISRFTAAGTDFWLPLGSTAGLSISATPMESLHQGLLPTESLREMLVGAHSGAIGEVPSAMLILGGLYLLLRKVISLRIPLFYLGSVALLTYFLPLGGHDPLQWMLYQLLGGGLLLGAIFMATDYTTSPLTPWGQILYAVCCGALTVFLRYNGAHTDGVCFAILIMNLCVRLFDRIGRPRRFGVSFLPWRKK